MVGVVKMDPQRLHAFFDAQQQRIDRILNENPAKREVWEPVLRHHHNYMQQSYAAAYRGGNIFDRRIVQQRTQMYNSAHVSRMAPEQREAIYTLGREQNPNLISAAGNMFGSGAGNMFSSGGGTIGAVVGGVLGYFVTGGGGMMAWVLTGLASLVGAFAGSRIQRAFSSENEAERPFPAPGRSPAGSGPEPAMLGQAATLDRARAAAEGGVAEPAAPTAVAHVSNEQSGQLPAPTAARVTQSGGGRTGNLGARPA